VIPFWLYGQGGELPDEQIIIQKDRKIVLPEIGKPSEKIVFSLKPLPKVKQKYTYREFAFQLPFLEPKVLPPQWKPEVETAVSNGYARLGAGNYGSTLFDLYYNSGRQKDYAWGGFIRHQASANGPVDNSGYSSNDAGAYGTYFTPNFSLGGELMYSRGRYNFYGYDQDRFQNRKTDSTRQLLQQVVFRMQLESSKRSKKLQYQAGLLVGNIGDRFKASESEIGMDLNGQYRLKDSSKIQISTDLALLKRSDSSSVNRSLWRFTPEYRFGYKGFQIRAGVQIAVANEPELDETGERYKSNSTGFHVYPRLFLQQDFLEKKLTIFGGVQGGMNKTTLRGTLAVNPFLAPDVYLRHENQLYDFFIGLKGQQQSQVSYRTQLSFERLRNQGFLVNNPQEQEKFLLVYDSSSTRRFSWETEFVYEPAKTAQAGIRFRLIRYGVSSLEEPWHAPNTILTLFGRMDLSDRIRLSGELYTMGGLRGLGPDSGQTIKLKPMADVQLKGEYFFLKRFSGFLSVHNLLNNKNQRFLYYPTQGLRIMVGATASF
jgi:hypothetical protein